MSDMDEEILKGVDTLRAAQAFLDKQFITESCRLGPPVDGCMSCDAIPIHDALAEFIDRYLLSWDRDRTTAEQDIPA